jgi:hypothetical protein
MERWLSLRLEFLGSLAVAGAALLGVLTRNTSAYAGLIGLSLVYAMRVTNMVRALAIIVSEILLTKLPSPSYTVDEHVRPVRHRAGVDDEQR